jgi:hypothetical protein
VVAFDPFAFEAAHLVDFDRAIVAVAGVGVLDAFAVDVVSAVASILWPSAKRAWSPSIAPSPQQA